MKNETSRITDIALQHAKDKIERHFEDKLTYALPEWAMLTGNPEIISWVEVRGSEGIASTKQRVDFNVNFQDKLSIIYYADFLNNQMNKHLETVGYVIFYDKNIVAKKDLNYFQDLTHDQNSELLTFNSEKSTTDISILMLNAEYKLIENF